MVHTAEETEIYPSDGIVPGTDLDEISLSGCDFDLEEFYDSVDFIHDSFSMPSTSPSYSNISDIIEEMSSPFNPNDGRDAFDFSKKEYVPVVEHSTDNVPFYPSTWYSDAQGVVESQLQQNECHKDVTGMLSNDIRNYGSDYVYQDGNKGYIYQTYFSDMPAHGSLAPPSEQPSHYTTLPQIADPFDGDSLSPISDTANVEFLSWTSKHPENWNSAEVLDWLYYTADRQGVDCGQLRGEAFRTLTGADLCKMIPADFAKLEPRFGPQFYMLFRELLSGLNFSHPPADPIDLDPSLYPFNSTNLAYDNSSSTLQQHHQQQQHQQQQQSSQFENMYIQSFQSGAPSSSLSHEQHQQNPQNIRHYQNPQHNQDDSRQRNEYQYVMNPTYEYEAQDLNESTVTNMEEDLLHYPHPYDRPDYRRHKSYSPSTSSASPKESGACENLVKRRPGRPRVKSLPSEEEIDAKDKKAKALHLWQFIYEMLMNPVYNPQIVKWENHKEGVFRFVQSDAVAHLWGTLKCNEHMTYEKLSRAMRHYYKRGILERVEGRRLVYKFSMLALEKLQSPRKDSGQ